MYLERVYFCTDSFLPLSLFASQPPVDRFAAPHHPHHDVLSYHRPTVIELKDYELKLMKV
jgi:hypothetical protein